MARFVDDPKKWEASNASAAEALGKLVISHPEQFGVEVVQDEKEAKPSS